MSNRHVRSVEYCPSQEGCRGEPQWKPRRCVELELCMNPTQGTHKEKEELRLLFYQYSNMSNYYKETSIHEYKWRDMVLNPTDST